MAPPVRTPPIPSARERCRGSTRRARTGRPQRGPIRSRSGEERGRDRRGPPPPPPAATSVTRLKSHRPELDRVKPVPGGNHAIGRRCPEEKQVLKDEGDAERQRQTMDLPLAAAGGRAEAEPHPEAHRCKRSARGRPAMASRFPGKGRKGCSRRRERTRPWARFDQASGRHDERNPGSEAGIDQTERDAGHDGLQQHRAHGAGAVARGCGASPRAPDQLAGTASLSRKTRRRSFPCSVRGSSATNSTIRGSL